MEIRLSNRDVTEPTGTSGREGHSRWTRLGRWTWIWLASALFMLLLIGWLLYSTHREPDAVSLAPLADAVPVRTAGNEKPAHEITVGEAPAAASPLRAVAAKSRSADALAAITPVEGLTLVRPSLRHGGLGSKALMTFAIRNRNDYPVKDIKLACTFSSRDRSYVTERRHLIHGVVRANSRKVFRRLLMGFVSIGASRAKCAVLSADWA